MSARRLYRLEADLDAIERGPASDEPPIRFELLPPGANLADHPGAFTLDIRALCGTPPEDDA